MCLLPNTTPWEILYGQSFDSKTLISSGGTDIFIAALSDLPQSVKETYPEAEHFDCFPNPATHVLHFSKKQNIRMSDLLGRTVLQCKDCDELTVAQLPEGAYYINGHQILIRHFIQAVH